MESGYTFELCVIIAIHIKQMKTINKRILLLAILFFGLFMIPSFICAFAQDEGTLGINFVWQIFAKLFTILRFPTHTLFWPIISKFGAVIYFLGLLVNCIFYGFITERIVHLFKFKKFK